MVTTLDLALTTASGVWFTIVARRSGRSGLPRSTSVWVPPGSAETRLLFADLESARSRVWWTLRGLPIRPPDLREGRGPALARVDVGDLIVVDALNPEGLAAADLPATFPFEADGTRVAPTRCRTVVARAHGLRADGVLSRPWAGCSGIELVYFPRQRPVRFLSAPQPFERWFWGAEAVV